MEKIIDLTQTVYALARRYPEVIEIMRDLGFQEIDKPGMLHTVGRFMTLSKGAAMKGISMGTLKAAFENRGFTIAEGEG